MIAVVFTYLLATKLYLVNYSDGLGLNYLISQQCCDSENESLNMRVNDSLAIVKTTF